MHLFCPPRRQQNKQFERVFWEPWHSSGVILGFCLRGWAAEMMGPWQKVAKLEWLNSQGLKKLETRYNKEAPSLVKATLVERSPEPYEQPIKKLQISPTGERVIFKHPPSSENTRAFCAVAVRENLPCPTWHLHSTLPEQSEGMVSRRGENSKHTRHGKCKAAEKGLTPQERTAPCSLSNCTQPAQGQKFAF